MELKQRIENCISDLMADLLFYSRKEDEDLPLKAIEGAIEDGTITKEWLAAEFKNHIDNIGE